MHDLAYGAVTLKSVHELVSAPVRIVECATRLFSSAIAGRRVYIENPKLAGKVP